MSYSKRSRIIADAMREGIERQGERVRLLPSSAYHGGPDSEIAVFYGYDAVLRRVMSEYRARGLTVVYIDLGYFGRRDGGTLRGYHKVVVNGRHPTPYFQARPHDATRAARFQVKPADWRRGRHIIVAGMGGKAAEAEGLRPEYWERKTIHRLRRLTDRPIIYRPKPNWEGARPIEGAKFAARREDLPGLFEDCHAVVTHHSNVGIDGLLAGVPLFTLDGVGRPLALNDINRIETPLYPDGREQWVNDLCYCQWNVSELRAGIAWRHLKDEGLVS